MKRITVIAILAAVITAGSVNADAKDVCPAPTVDNSGWVGEDANNDGHIDHIWRVYTSGKCAGQAVDQTETVEIIATFKPQ